MRNICLLGMTGSIGKNVIDVVKSNPQDFKIVSGCFNSNVDEFSKLIKYLPDLKKVLIGKKSLIPSLKNQYPNIEFYCKDDGYEKIILTLDVDMVVNSLVGFEGLYPSLLSINNDLILCLANKESLVVGGSLVLESLKKHPSSRLYPIDSEHSSLYKLLNHYSKDDIDSIYITASGGSFRDLTFDQLENVTLEQALNHPSWKMGSKITIDSATMMNKGFEVIEAYYLFSLPLDKIHVLLHDESLIHALIRMKDGSLIADMATNDMRIPISYALYEGKYHSTNVPKLDLESILSLHFRKMDPERYPSLNLAYDALRKGKTYLCVLNASNEEANLAFREGRLKFNQIEKVVASCLNNHQVEDNFTYQDLKRIDYQTRLESRKIIENLK